MNNPEFFNEEDFIQLSKFAGQANNGDNPEKQKTYDFLKETYNKTEYWARQVQEKVFPNGHVVIRRRPTNQGNHFEQYHWAKIYPDKNTLDKNILAFTIGIDTDLQFMTKIDTIGLNEGDERRQKYLKERGDIYESAIVDVADKGEILQKGWNELINRSVDTIENLKPAYDKMFNLLVNNLADSQPLGGSIIDESRNDSISPKNEDVIEKRPKNLILYGPPGTGKTHNTIEIAIKITNPGFNFYEARTKKTRATIKEKYNRLIDEKQIVFTTFHQSMSFEDFIEGIKPEKPDNATSLHYNIVDGIFKLVCNEARRTNQLSVTIDDVTKPLSKELFEEFYYSFSDTLPLHADSISSFTLKTKESYTFELFKNTVGSIVVKAGLKKTNSTVSFNELSAVLFDNKIPMYKSYEQIILNKILEDKKFQKGDIDNTQKNFVLIIDEINRGNISQIFGELITLIEEDKREGSEEALSVILPYSKRQFTVPPNVYIVGTMNTADRSVEAIDTALRRRFSFEFMPPEAGYVSQIDIKGISLKTIFNQINERITFLLDADHQIGHSYFMNIADVSQLRHIFRNKIIPLLKEYFYNDYKKIYLVLGDGFVEKKENKKPKFAIKGDDELERDVYSIRPIGDDFPIQEALMKVYAE